MMNDFQYSMFHSKMETEKTTIQKEFLNFRNMIELNEQQFEQTVSFYLSSYKEKIESINEQYRIDEIKAREKFNSIYKESKGNEDERYSWASHASGLDNIYYEYDELKNSTKELYHNYLDSIGKSMIITICSLVESSLYKICEMAHKEMSLNEEPSEKNPKHYLKGSFDYLQQTVKLNQKHYSKFYTQLIDFKNLRNGITHNNSNLVENEFKKLDALFKTSISSEKVGDELHQVKIKNGDIIRSFFRLTKVFFESVHWAFEEKLKFEPIKERCLLWFSILDKEIEISYFKADKISQNKVEIDFLFSSVTEKIKNMRCQIVVNPRQSKSKVLENTTKFKVIDAFIEFTHKHSGVLFKGVFDLVYFSKKSMKVEVEFQNKS